MITINSNKEAERLIRNGVLVINDDLEINFDGFSIDADIKCRNIYSKGYERNINCNNINCNNINCNNINCNDIKCNDINCNNIDCYDIKCNDIDCNNIDCNNIDCYNINCNNIDCNDINYYAVAFAYSSFKCKSITGIRYNSKHFCLDGEIEYKTDNKKEELINKAEELREKADELLDQANNL